MVQRSAPQPGHPALPFLRGPRRFARRLGLWVVTATLIVGLSEGGLVVVQAVAWAKMIVTYSRTRSWWNALEDTFDGEHPCDLCKGLKKARQSSREQPHEPCRPPETREAVLVEPGGSSVPDQPWSWLVAAGERTWRSFEDPPPTPPPRRAPGSPEST